MVGTTYGFFLIKEKLKFSAFPSSGAQHGSRQTRSDGGHSSEGRGLWATALTFTALTQTAALRPSRALGLAAWAALTRPLPCPPPGLQGEEWQPSEGVFLRV